MREDERLRDVRRQLQRAEADGDEHRQTSLWEALGDIYLEGDKYDLAFQYYSKISASETWHLLPQEVQARIRYKMARTHLGRAELERALQLATQAERMLSVDEETPLLAKIYALAGRIHRRLGDHHEALAYSNRALYMLRHSKENQEIAQVQLSCGSIFLRQGKVLEAVRYFQDSLSTYRRIEDKQGIAWAYNNLGVAYKNLCRWDDATRSLRRAMKIDQESGNYAGVALRTMNLGVIQLQRGEWDSSREYVEKAMQMFQAVGDPIGVTRCSYTLARISRRLRRWTEAKRFATEALRMASSSGSRREIASSFEELGSWHFDRGQYTTARTYFRKSLAVAQEISSQNDHIAEVNRRLADISAALGEPEEGIQFARKALSVAVTIRDKRFVGLAMRSLARNCRISGDRKRAARYAGRSVRMFETIGMPFELGRSLLESARASRMVNDLGAARQNLTRAEAIFRRFSSSRYSCRVLLEFSRLKLAADRLEDALVLLGKAEKFVELDRQTEESVAIEELRQMVADRFIEDSVGIENRYLHRVEHRSDGADETLQKAVGPLGADRVILFVRNGSGTRVCESLGITTEEAAAVLEEATSVWKSGGIPKPMVSFAGGSDTPDLSWLIAPGDEEGSCGIYVDRTRQNGIGEFTRRDLNYLVYVAQTLGSMGSTTLQRDSGDFDGVITNDERMLDILEMLAKLRGMQVTILLQGETGTGKGLIAKEVSKGNTGPFVTINCADLTEGLLESELFGHVRSAFTGASSSKKGLFEVADGGTVFIDEIDKTSRNFQEKLLRVVDRREFKPVGSVNVKKVDCRIVCASNIDLRTAVERGEFLADLYYRLKVISIHIPPLRERRGDIPLLAQHFVKAIAIRHGKSGVNLAPEVLDFFSRYPWPGNVRDLENEIQRAVALAPPGALVGLGDLSDELLSFDSGGVDPPRVGERRLVEIVADLEARIIRDTLRKCGGNKSQTARILGLTRKGLRNKIARYGVDT